MAGGSMKLTEKAVGSANVESYVLVTQKELPSDYVITGNEEEGELDAMKIESVRRIPTAQMVEMIQENLDVDDEPTDESDALITSGSVKAELDRIDEELSSYNEDITNIREVYETRTGINLFNPAYLTGAGWSYDNSTGEYVGTVYQIRQIYNYVLPITFKPNTQYLLTFDLCTEGNQGTTDTDGFIVRLTHDDSSRYEKKIKNSQTTVTHFAISTYIGRSLESITISYASLGENIWHLTNVMLVEGYGDLDTDIPDYEPYQSESVIYTAIDLRSRNSKQDKLTFDQTPVSGSSNPVTSDGVYRAVASKQDALTIDSVPTSGSNNPISSSGVYAVVNPLSSKIESVTEEQSSEPSINLFNPTYFTDAGWTFNPTTGEYAGTLQQIRDAYTGMILPIPSSIFKEHTQYCLYFTIYTEGNQGTTGNGLKITITLSDGNNVVKNIPNSQTTPMFFAISSWRTMANRNVTNIKFSYESSSENVWHLTDVMLVEGYDETDTDLPAYIPYGESETTYTAVDSIARASATGNASAISMLHETVSAIRPTYPNWLTEKRWGSHIGVSQYTNVVIPSQSIFDVERSARLGFKILELNVQVTSDGKFITIHGSQGKFGSAVKLIDGTTDIQNTLISTVTLAYIEENVRYISDYEKYRTTIPTLEDMLYECRVHGIVPLIQYQPGVIEIADAIMGRNNYVLSIYDQDRPNGFDGVCISWLTLPTAEQLLDKADASGGLYVCNINAASSAYNNFTKSDWRNVANTLHNAGYLVGFVGGYVSEPLAQTLIQSGFDFGVSTWHINDFKNANLCELHGDTDFSDFKIADTAIVSDGVLTLQENENISLPDSLTLPIVFLGGGILKIRFNGTLIIGLGRYIDTQFTSDGLQEMVISTYFENRVPTFYAKAIGGNTTIYDISLKITKM